MRMLPIVAVYCGNSSVRANWSRCEVTPHPFGMELRYLVNGKPILSRVFEEWEALEAAAAAWCEGLLHRGWHASNRPAA